jgi:hypothetical protein
VFQSILRAERFYGANDRHVAANSGLHKETHKVYPRTFHNSDFTGAKAKKAPANPPKFKFFCPKLAENRLFNDLKGTSLPVPIFPFF